MIETTWIQLPERFPTVETDAFVVMPNHFHGILVIADETTPTRVAPTTLGQMIGAFKSITTHDYIRGVKDLGWPAFDGRLWQRNYYEHGIRNEASLQEIREYIATNPRRWALDKLNPANTK